MSQFVYIDGDDWKGIYKDGVLVGQGHDFHPQRLFELLEIDIDVRFADLEWLGDLGNFPDKIQDVKYEG